MEQQLTIEMIADAFSYDITGFDCGEEALNTFLKSTSSGSTMDKS